MNDRSLLDLLTELDAELARQSNPRGIAHHVLECVETRCPGAVQRSAAGIELRNLGCASSSARV